MLDFVKFWVSQKTLSSYFHSPFHLFQGVVGGEVKTKDDTKYQQGGSLVRFFNESKGLCNKSTNLVH